MTLYTRAVVITTIQLRFDGRSTAVRLRSSGLILRKIWTAQVETFMASAEREHI